MTGPVPPDDEASRLALLRELDVLDSEPEPIFDRVTQLAAHLFEMPIALVSLVDTERQWFKARVGLAARETPREDAFCAWTIHGDDVLTVPDAAADPRFAEHPLVVGEPNIRFYAGAPLKSEAGALGTLCVIDRKPRTFADADRTTLEHLAAIVTEALVLRRDRLVSDRRARLLAAAEELAAIGHWRVDLARQTLFWSDQVYRIHGLDPATYTPTLEAAIEAYHPDDRDLVARSVERCIAEREPADFEARIVRPDGSVRLVRAMGVSEGAGAEAVGIFGVFHDITERKELRDRLTQAEKLASIGTMAAGVAHEINNPLTYVKVNALTLAEEMEAWMGDRPSGRLVGLHELVEEIRDGAERIERIMGGLKVFSRRSEGRREEVDLERVVQLAQRLCANELRHAARFELEVEAPARVTADETQLVQVAVNLIVNACQAMEGDAEANLVRARIGRAGDRAFLVVSDTGAGMSEDVRRQLFTPFFTTKERGVGTGLGLAITHGIVTSFGGTIDVASELGSGTSFRIELPAREDDA
ncbi:MAG: ATP-binding protein [Myxococcota bacterium]